jgi:hypothetical protein
MLAVICCAEAQAHANSITANAYQPLVMRVSLLAKNLGARRFSTAAATLSLQIDWFHESVGIIGGRDKREQ